MSGRGHDWSGSVDAGGSLSPAEARRDASDRLVGRRAMISLRIVMVVTVIMCTTFGMLVDPVIGGIDSRFLRAAMVTVWVLPSITALVVIIVCRRPARRQVFAIPQRFVIVFGMREAINFSAWTGVVMGGIGVVASHYGEPLVAVVICGVSVVCGLATLVLHYAFRERRVL